MKELIKKILIKTGFYYKIAFWYKDNLKQFKQQKQFYSRIIKKEDIVFDIGANVGHRSDIFRRLCKKVIAVEPQAFCISHLKSRFMLAHNVIIEPLAIDAKEGETLIYESDSHTISSMSATYIAKMKATVFTESRWDKEVKVKTTTLDHLVNKHGKPSFIKIDVEGFELNVLRSLTAPVKCLSIEFTPLMIDELKKCISEINRISPDYKFNYSLGEQLSLRLNVHQAFDLFLKFTIDKELAIADSFGDVYAFLN